MRKSGLAVVTGGGTGLGRSIAERFLADGFEVLITGRDGVRLAQAAREMGATALAGDVADAEDVAALAEEVRGHGVLLRVLVKNAGVMPMSRLSDRVDRLFSDRDQAMRINLTGTLRVTHALAPLIAAPGGRIVNLSSIVARTGGSAPGLLAYTATKGGIDGLTFALARELAERGITVNAVAPDSMDGTAMTADLGDERKARINANIPLGALGTPGDIPGAVAYLAGPGGGYVTGQVLHVNGGWRFG